MAKHGQRGHVKSCNSQAEGDQLVVQDVDENDLDNVSREVIETVSNSTSTMLEKADKQDVAGFQSLTIWTLNAKHSTTSDIDQYKVLNIKEDALDNRKKCLDVL